MAKNDLKKLSHPIYQELYLIWLWLLLHMCKMMISPAIFFHFFKILIFQVFQGSSINAKRKFWGVPNLLHMCVIFVFLNEHLLEAVILGAKKPCLKISQNAHCTAKNLCLWPATLFKKTVTGIQIFLNF